jgi:hypothetical protein
VAERPYGGLEIEEDLERQERAWKWERVGCGLERMDQIKYAVLERHGGITVVPRRA